MTFEHFIQQANVFGKQRAPFLFVIDFEQQKPLIVPLAQAKSAGVLYDITFGQQRLRNFAPTDAPSPLPITLQAWPPSFDHYHQAFDHVQRALQHGDTYLLNLTCPTPITLGTNFEQLFYQGQAKYKIWLKDAFVCFSPECFVEIHHNQIHTYPMKGTIAANLVNAEQQLLDNIKEKQEHYTIVDLLRNDLAMVATHVKVDKFRYVDSVTTHHGDILQTSSHITGKLEQNWQARIGTLLATLLPAGSICGAPKQKTLEVIRQAEGQPRGYYTGVFGLFLGEALVSAVTIRYIEQQGKQLYFRSGGGITALSDAKQEYDELLKKVYLPVANSASSLTDGAVS